MKIFFVRARKCRFGLRKKAGVFLIFALAGTIVAGQTQMFVGHRLTETSAVSESLQGRITLSSDRVLSGDTVYVLKDGEKALPFDGTSVTLDLDKTSVIEIYSGDDEPFNVKIQTDGKGKIYDGHDSAVCDKGMNYICRYIIQTSLT